MMMLFNKRASKPMQDVEVFADILEDVFACIPGSFEYDVLSDERMNNLHKRVIAITNENGDKLAEVFAECYPVDDEYIVEVVRMERITNVVRCKTTTN